MVASQNTEVGIADLPALLIEYQLAFQSEQRILYKIISDSVDFTGPHQMQDLRHVLRKFTRGDLRDGIGFWKWIATFHDQSTFEAQKKLAVQVNAAKIKSSITLDGLELFTTTLLEKWCHIAGNSRSQPAAFNDTLHRAFPDVDQHGTVITSLRLWLAEEIHKDPAESRNVADPDRLVHALVTKAQ